MGIFRKNQWFLRGKTLGYEQDYGHENFEKIWRKFQKIRAKFSKYSFSETTQPFSLKFKPEQDQSFDFEFQDFHNVNIGDFWSEIVEF